MKHYSHTPVVQDRNNTSLFHSSGASAAAPSAQHPWRMSVNYPSPVPSKIAQLANVLRTARHTSFAGNGTHLYHELRYFYRILTATRDTDVRICWVNSGKSRVNTGYHAYILHITRRTAKTVYAVQLQIYTVQPQIYSITSFFTQYAVGGNC